ncbi:MAG: glycosyltransferase [Deltaproteobacteria bacterium]|jgi:GT2 family glycosyltransferase|nr:glycosyltransferase [Deltaproteobacteria bacterium]
MTYLPQTSIVIPACNQWELTRACLTSLAATLPGESCEVIVVDNASGDATPEACPALGAELFGRNFIYRRAETNLNFGPASNLGAKLGRGEYVLFLNNDTVALPGWYEPLLSDFADYQNIAATGPVLLYPPGEPFGHTVQHLGVFVSPHFHVGHLYEGIPANCALAKKRRFFQVITAACMLMRRSVFMEAGMFDEAYVNGFEDVDLCARLSSRGYRMTVNPEAWVVHHASSTPGRHQQESANFRRLASCSLSLLSPDWHMHLKNDGMLSLVGPWQTLQTSLPPEQCARLDKIAAKSARGELADLLARHPFWENGWKSLLHRSERESGRMELQSARFRLFPAPDGAMELCKSAIAACDSEKFAFWFANLQFFCRPFEEYLATAESMRAWCANIGLGETAEQYAGWLAGAERFRTGLYLPFFADFWRLATQMRLQLHPHVDWAYTLWRHNVDLPRRAAEAGRAVPDASGSISFSILMPVYNPKAEHLTAALESVMAQNWPHWELCIADDASTDPEVEIILTRYVERDSRIRVVRRMENGHIAAATNTALGMARHPYAILLDQDDLLPSDALRVVAGAVAEHPDGLLFYSDEDKLGNDGSFFYPYFKNGVWDWELLCGQNFVSHLGVYRTERLREIRGFREGFRGSQDWDMLLRYITGADAARFIHIPRVLYHWRAHADSTATDAGVKGEAVDSARRAVQDYLETFSPGAEACILPDMQFLRVKFPLPGKRPLVSLICGMGEALPLLKAQLSALADKTAYGKYEIIVQFDQTLPPASIAKARYIAEGYKNVRLSPHAPDLSAADRLLLGAAQARGQVLGFLSGGVVPMTDNWLEELVSCLCREGVGAVGGKLLQRNGTLAHGGYLVDASGNLAAVFRALPTGVSVWFSWNYQARTVNALDGMCLFTRSETLAELGGFDSTMPDASVQDYCLRLGEKGLRTVWWPFAGFMLLDGREERMPDKLADDSGFAARWAGRLTPFNENLVVAGPGWSLCAHEPCGGEKAGLAVNLRLRTEPEKAAVSRQATKAATPQGGARRLKAAEQAGNSVSGEAILTPERQARRDIIVADFSAADYLALYPDVRASGMEPLEHYLRFGRGEGRKPCRTQVDYSRLTPERLAGFHAAPAGDVVVCTSIAGGYEKLLPPAFLNDGWRYVCYADAPVEAYGIWEIRPIPYEHADSTRKARWIKLHLPELFPEARWILWLDANIILNGDLSPCMASCDGKLPLYSVPHPCRTCLYDEALACIDAGKDEPEIIRRQVAAYAEQGMPKHYGLPETNLLLLNPRHPQARPLFSRWWAELETRSKRDQISLPYALFRLGIPQASLLPDGGTPRRHSSFYFLTHEETGLVSVPEFVKRVSAS